MERSSGILLPVFSLPSPYGIGSLGRPARDFVDFLSAAGQRWWQMLPLGPTGFGDSPYQSFSSFAGNPYFLDPDALCADGLLTKAELDGLREADASPALVDYGRLYAERLPLLRRAARRGLSLADPGFRRFFEENAAWLDDYALFISIKAQFHGASWTEWPEEYRLRDDDALRAFREAHTDELAEHCFLQYLFSREFSALRRYATQRQVALIGDIPFYAAADSADVWARREQFALDTEGRPIAVAGVPPDYFSDQGQLWGNPLYDWERMASDGFAWWRRRIAAAASRCDMLRLDHFRAISAFWAVPAGAASAAEGEWRPGPGLPFIACLNSSFPSLRFLAEDLGILTPDVEALRDAAGWPGMKVLQFAFSAGENSRYLPREEPDRDVSYTGTHDNETLRGWSESISDDDRRFAMEYLGVSSDAELADAVLQAGMRSGSELFVSRIQDWLGLDDSARINTPGTREGSWRWRMTADMLSPALSARIAEATREAGRA